MFGINYMRTDESIPSVVSSYEKIIIELKKMSKVIFLLFQQLNVINFR